MNCRDAEPLLHARLDNELDVAGAMNVDRHLLECRACAAQFAALQDLKQEIAAAQPAAAVRRQPVELAQRRDADAGVLRGRQDRVTLAGGEQLAIDRQRPRRHVTPIHFEGDCTRGRPVRRRTTPMPSERIREVYSSRK